ncbi:uncharacterized protein Dana_GF26952, isoform B [Drosophila ananassae]|uniref:Uncharacterized protein, isoform B n=1 Tax=Drosophila ananassae TaxID=7217 RepID=A0A0P8YD48_DROAN|nr:uncharacterized protein Dana_GF26952, isoform B [Drosophila ananassae]
MMRPERLRLMFKILDGVAEDEHDGNDDDDNKCTTLWPPALTPLSWRLAFPLPFHTCPGEVDTCLPMRGHATFTRCTCHARTKINTSFM